jgi:hypothetical protein
LISWVLAPSRHKTRQKRWGASPPALSRVGAAWTSKIDDFRVRGREFVFKLISEITVAP